MKRRKFHITCTEPYFLQILLALALVASASAQWPAGVSPAACPNYPYCNEDAGILAYSGTPAITQYPAGVSAASCPNYPHCFQGWTVCHFVLSRVDGTVVKFEICIEMEDFL